MVYTSETIALAKLETIANSDKIPINRSLIAFEIDNEAPLIEIALKDLPKNWLKFPYRPNWQKSQNN